MDKKIKKMINKKISLLMAVSIIIIVVVAQALSAAQLKTVMTEQSHELLKTKAENNADIIDSWINDQVNVLIAMKESLAYIDDLDGTAIMDYLEIQLNNSNFPHHMV